MKSQKFSNLIQLNAESIGIKALDNEIINYLNIEIEEKLRLIISQSKKYMRISKRKTMKIDDLNNALKNYNFEELIGYDSFSNCEFEKIENVKGLWKQKQSIIDFEDYLTKPISSCPMKPFPHFFWFCLSGVQPEISETFIRENKKEEVNQIKSNGNDTNILSNFYLENSSKNDFKKIPVIHNISRELQIFFANFIQRFYKEINLNASFNSPYVVISKEFQISIDVIRISPGVVELLPYILEFLINNLKICSNPKNIMIILNYTSSIIINQFFFIEPYLHQILKILLSLILMNIPENNNYIDNIIIGKLTALKQLQLVIQKFKLKYPNFIFQLTEIFNENILKFKDNNKLLFTLFGCIEAANMLGPIYNKIILTEENKTIIEAFLKEKFTFINKNEFEEKYKDLYIKNNYETNFNTIGLIMNSNEKCSNIDEYSDLGYLDKLIVCIYYSYKHLNN